MRYLLSLLSALVVASPASGQELGPVPERLLIGPEEYLKAPDNIASALRATRSFSPIDLAAANRDSIRAANLAPREWGMANARPCRPVSLADTTSWHRNGDLLLPEGFTPDSTFRSYHGGLKWGAEDLALIVENGWWGVAYDSAAYLTSCRVRARAGEYIVSETRTPGGFEFRAFPWDPEWRPSGAIVGQASTEERLRILWTAFMTMLPPRCRYMTGDPVRDPRASPC